MLIALLVVQQLSLLAKPAISPSEINALYVKANGYFNLSHPTASTDSEALSLFGKIIKESEKTHSNEEILFQSYTKKGILLDVKGNYAEALGAYSGALDCLRRHPYWNDSLYFKIYIYSGPDYYQLDNFDSAYAVLNRAELLADKHPGLPERDRLYNALGALYYESGNYLQGKNYFVRALEITRRERPQDKISAVNFENNIASCLYKMGDYRESLKMYRHLLQIEQSGGQPDNDGGKSSSQLDLNIGKSCIGIEEYSQALAFYRKVSPVKVPGVLNEMAYAELLMKKLDSALFFLDRWQTITGTAQQTKIDAGINELYRAQVKIARQEPEEGIQYLQQAIITFSGTFKNTNFHSNPVNFTGSFASYRLFDALSYKAVVLETLYQQKGREEYLLAALNAYRSAIILFRYIEKTYTIDDAKLFLKKNNQELYQNAFATCLELDRLHPGGPYLEEAFLIAEKSKSSIVSASLDEMASQKMPGIDQQMLKKQKDIKYKIGRLQVMNDPEQRGSANQDMAEQKADYEIELSFIQKSMEINSAYYKMKFEDACPSVEELQGGLTAHQAIVSLYVSKAGLHVFIVTASSFRCLLIDSVAALTEQVGRWIGILNNTGQGHRWGDKALESALYSRLVKPLLSALKGKDEWTIIPDGLFYLLPFESLPADEDGHPLIENITVSYQLSAKFLSAPFRNGAEKLNNYSVLSFAPFSAKGEWVDAHALRYVDRLPASGKEIAGLPGRQFLDREATKERFLQELNHYPVVHLATHALPDPRNNQSSLICFYPRGKGAEEDNLFLPEIYGLNMDSTGLVILSACESGKGAIVDNEGMMSLSRAFLYAGCASTINSLWKADDRSTEIILRQFHVLLEQGYSKSAALRLAKLNYIHSNTIYHTPDFWAHLILIGNTDAIIKEKGGSPGWGVVLAGGLLCLIIGPLFVRRRGI